MKPRMIIPASITESFDREIERELDTSRPVVQYIRRSTENQRLRNQMSLVQQDEKLGAKLVGKGFGHIEKIDIDDGKSGQRLLEDRAGLQYVYDLLEGRALIDGQSIAAVGAFDASRMWRDTTHVWYDDFIQKLIANNVPFITWRRTYWPQDSRDMDALRREFEYALKSLETITERAIPARFLAVEENSSYGGHAIPPGFIISGFQTDKHYAVYEEHRKLVVYLFERFKECGGNIPRLLRELLHEGFHFPEFTIENPPHLALPHIPGVGYFVNTRRALVSILTNRAYIGHYIFTKHAEGTVRFDEKKQKRVRVKGRPEATYVNEHAHEAIVDYDLFVWCYEKITGYTLDGIPVQSRPERRYGTQTNALLDGILTSCGNPVYAIAAKAAYVAREYDHDLNTTTLTVSIKQVDTIVGLVMDSIVMQETLNGTDALARRIREVQQGVRKRAADLGARLAVIDNGIRGWELDKQSAREKGYKPGLDRANEELAKLASQRAAIEEEMKRATQDDSVLAECADLMERVRTGWTCLEYGHQRRLAKLVIIHADIREVAPHMLCLALSLGIPISRKLAVYFYRARGTHPAWTEAENAILRQYYPYADRKIVMEKLRTRTWESAIMQAGAVLHLVRTTRENTSTIPDNMTYADQLVLQELGIPMSEARNKAIWPQVRDITSEAQPGELVPAFVLLEASYL